jgi:multiple sugar transport system substrate-binding protein
MTAYIKNVGFTPSNPDNLGLWYSQYSQITGMSVADLKTLVAGARKYGIESPNHLIVNFSQISNTLQKYLDAIYYGQGTVTKELTAAQAAVNAIVAQNAG